jgi:predicted Holliday junction resolvase-like endonuclease
MELTIMILLGLILITLVCILLICVGSLDNLQKQTGSIRAILDDTRQYTKLLEENIKDKVGHIYNMSTDMKYHQRKLREQEMAIAIETLKSIDASLSDLKLLHDDVLSLKESLEKSVGHPAFSINNKDTD